MSSVWSLVLVPIHFLLCNIPSVAVIVGAISLWIASDLFSRSRPIPGVFEIPGLPVVGNVFSVLDNSAKTYLFWSQYYGQSVFQIRLGSSRAVVVNSFEDVQQIWVKQACATSSRPMGYTFHNVVSSTQGFTVGSSPQGESFRRKKKSLSMNLNSRNVHGTHITEIIDGDSDYTMNKLLQQESSEVDLLPFFQLFALRSSVFLSYGIHLDCYGVDSTLCSEILHVENQIIHFRSPSANLADYIPLLRILPTWAANNCRDRRDAYMNYLFQKLISRLHSHYECRESIVGRILMSETHGSLTREEIQSICLTLVSAGLDNTSLNLNHLMGQLSQPVSGEEIQATAFQSIMSTYDNDSQLAWSMISREMKCDFVLALIHETLRFFTVLPMALPRLSTKCIIHKGAVIPPKTRIFMNAFAVNHDPTRFSNPYCFIPERWLDTDTRKLLPKSALLHFSFGAGSRMCSGNQLAMKELYTITCKMLLLYKIHPPACLTNLMGLDMFEMNSRPSSTSFEPRVFKVTLEPREDYELLRQVISRNH